MKFKLSSDDWFGEFYFDARCDAEYKAAQLGWRSYKIEVVEKEI